MKKYVYVQPNRGVVFMQKRYGFWNFALDALLTMCTGGLWLIWIFIREIRNN